MHLTKHNKKNRKNELEEGMEEGAAEVHSQEKSDTQLTVERLKKIVGTQTC